MHKTVNNLILINKELSAINSSTKIIAVSKTFPIEHIMPIIDYGHLHFGENTAGCGPAHRATPLAALLDIPINQLILIVKKEAKITHFDEDAGNGAAIVIMLCRYLLEGKSYYDAENLVCNDKDLKDSWIKLQKAELKPDGYIYNVIFSALHFIKEDKTLSDAIKFSGKANYCSIIFSVIKNCMTINSDERM